MKSKFVFSTLFVAAFALGGAVLVAEGGGDLPPPGVKVEFDNEGRAAYPKGYRSWVNTHTSWESITTSFLDGEVGETPELHSVYVEPNTYRIYMRTGEWPEGALIVKEFNRTSVDPENCSGEPAFTCDFEGSTVIFPHGYNGLAMMHKDSARYPGEPGGWAYFSFGHRAPPYETMAAPHPREQCAQCHITNVGPEYDYVWSAKINQPGFRRDMDNIKHNLELGLGE